MIQRLNNDIHVTLESLEYYDSVQKAGLTLHSANELCVIRLETRSSRISASPYPRSFRLFH